MGRGGGGGKRTGKKERSPCTDPATWPTSVERGGEGCKEKEIKRKVDSGRESASERIGEIACERELGD